MSSVPTHHKHSRKKSHMNYEGVSPKETGFLCVWVGYVKVRNAREGSNVSRNSGNKYSGGNLYPIFQGH